MGGWQAPPAPRRPFAQRAAQAISVVTSIVPLVAFEYGQMKWPRSAIFSATARSTPGIVTKSFTFSPKPPSDRGPMPTWALRRRLIRSRACAKPMPDGTLHGEHSHQLAA